MSETMRGNWGRKTFLWGLVIGGGSLLVSALGWSIYARAAAPSGQVMKRDATAEQEILNEMHRMHEAFDRGDVDMIANSLADDDFLFVYELDPDGKAVKLNSKAELLEFLQPPPEFRPARVAWGRTAS